MKKTKTAGTAERIGRGMGEGVIEGARSRIGGLLEHEIGPFWSKMHKELPETAKELVGRVADEVKNVSNQTIRDLTLPVALGAAAGAAAAPEGERWRGVLPGAVGGLGGGLVGRAWGRKLSPAAALALGAGGSAAGGAAAGATLRHKEAESQERKPMKNKFAGVVIDFYDDKGETLKTVFPTVESLPEVIKTASVRPQEVLGNEDFALIALDEGHVMRKYACHDPGTTAMSVVYFMEHGDKLPDGAQKVAAANLAQACVRFDMRPPEALCKMAGGLGGGAVGFGEKESEKQADALAGGKADGKSNSDFNQEQMARGRKVEQEHTGNPQVAAEIARDHLEEIPDYYTRLDKMEEQAKHANVVDITSKRPTPKFKVASSTNPEDYAVILNGRGYYPLHTWDMVKTAEAYYQEEHKRMQPEVRRQYAVKLASKATSMGYPLDADILEAGSRAWASKGHLKAAVDMRKIACQPGGEDRKFLDELFEKRASLEPTTYAEVLRRFDVQRGFDKGWDHVILDPWTSTFGLNKTADVVWEEGADRVTSEDLQRLAVNHVSLDNQFTPEMRKEFVKDPVGIFESLPLPMKKVVARLATDLTYQSEAAAL